MRRRSSALIMFAFTVAVLLGPSSSQADKAKKSGDRGSDQAVLKQLKLLTEEMGLLEGPASLANTIVILLSYNNCAENLCDCSQLGSNGMQNNLAVGTPTSSIAWITTTNGGSAKTITVEFQPPPSAADDSQVTPFYTSKFTDPSGNVSAPAPGLAKTKKAYYKALSFSGKTCRVYSDHVDNPPGIIMM